MAINYTEIILCASELHVFHLVLIFCPDSADVAKNNYKLSITDLLGYPRTDHKNSKEPCEMTFDLEMVHDTSSHHGLYLCHTGI